MGEGERASERRGDGQDENREGAGAVLHAGGSPAVRLLRRPTQRRPPRREGHTHTEVSRRSMSRPLHPTTSSARTCGTARVQPGPSVQNPHGNVKSGVQRAARRRRAHARSMGAHFLLSTFSCARLLSPPLPLVHRSPPTRAIHCHSKELFGRSAPCLHVAAPAKGCVTAKFRAASICRHRLQRAYSLSGVSTRSLTPSRPVLGADTCGTAAAAEVWRTARRDGGREEEGGGGRQGRAHPRKGELLD